MFLATVRVLSALFSELGVAGQGFGHTFTSIHTTLYPGNVRNLRSQMLKWGYPLSSDSRQLLTLQGHRVNDVWFFNIGVVKQIEYVVMA